MLDFAIEKLTELLIKQDFDDKQKGKITYVKKTQCYKDLIKLLKEIKDKKIIDNIEIGIENSNK